MVISNKEEKCSTGESFHTSKINSHHDVDFGSCASPSMSSGELALIWNVLSTKPHLCVCITVQGPEEHLITHALVVLDVEDFG
jgi:hypothetical protein